MISFVEALRRYTNRLHVGSRREGRPGSHGLGGRYRLRSSGLRHESDVIGMRRTPSGTFELPVSAAQAIGFFTPEGERDWVPGWNSAYPSGEASESAGTVFTTEAGGVETIWIVQRIDRDEYSSEYSRVTPGYHAGTVNVHCADHVGGGCVVIVRYDVSLLPGGDPTALHAYDDSAFDAMMGEWAAAVVQVLSP